MRGDGSDELTFGSYQRWFQDYDEVRDLAESDPTASVTHLLEELGEIARHVLRLEGHKRLEPDSREAEIEALALELSDAFVFLTKLANSYGIEWERTIRRAMEKAEERYPLELGQQEAARRRAARNSDL
jgi:NTP pyrophosphatase (non-canonical NTP hydrolase)